MKIVAMTGNSSRHIAIVKALHETGFLKLWIMEERESPFPEPPAGLEEDLKNLFIRHFKERDIIERSFFPDSKGEMDGVEKIKVSLEELNSDRIADVLREQNPDLLISYGVHKLSTKTLNAVKGHKWNCHGGLSPWYRGVITHFWPSYMLEPQNTGMTVHLLSEQIDGGDIIHQTVAQLVRGDGVHHTACRAVQSLVSDIPTLIEFLAENKITPAVPQKTTGKLWISKDWRPEHLKAVYELYGNKVVDAYLDGKLAHSEPKLVRQFPPVATS